MEIVATIVIAGLIAGAYYYLRDRRTTEAELHRAYDRVLRRAGPDDPAVALPAWRLAWVYLSQDRIGDAIEVLEACARAARAEPRQPALAAWALAELAVCRAKVGEYDLALRCLDEADDAWGSRGPTDAVRLARAEAALESCREIPVLSRVLEAESILRALLRSESASPSGGAGPYRAARPEAASRAEPSADGTLGPEHIAFVHIRLAEALFHRGSEGEAAEHERIGFGLYERDHSEGELAAFLVLQARWHERQGRAAHARALFVRVLDLPPSAVPAPVRGSAALELADIAMREDDTTEARSVLARAEEDLSRSPADADMAAIAEHGLARLSDRSSGAPGARSPAPLPQHDYVADAQRRAAIARDDFDAVFALLDRLAEALEATEHPTSRALEAWVHLAGEARGVQHTELAERAQSRIDALIGRDDVEPSARLAHRLLTLSTCIRRGDFDAATRAIAAIAELEGPFIEAHVHHASGWRSLVRGDYAKAAESYDRAAELMRPHHAELDARASSLLGAAWALAQLGRFEEARARRDAAAALVAITAYARERRVFLHVVGALVAIGDGRTDVAIAEATDAVDRARLHAGVRSELYAHAEMTLARAHLAAGDRGTAARHAEVALAGLRAHHPEEHPEVVRARELVTATG